MGHVRIHRAELNGSGVLVALAALAAAFAFSMAPLEASAQITGRVTTEDGRPLAGVSIALWCRAQLRVEGITNGEGAFSLRDTSDCTSDGQTVVARSIGYRPVSRPVMRPTEHMSITLVRLPTLLEEVSTTARAALQRDPCARKPTAEARALFARAASFYRDDTRWLDRIARYGHAVRTTHGGNRETMIGVPLRGGWTSIAGLFEGATASNASAVPSRLSASQRRRLPFPAPERRWDSHGEVVGWLYPRFWEWQAPSFVSAAFVDSMPKAIVSRGADGIVLSYCPRSRRVPYSSGEIQLAPDTTIVAVHWQFTVVKPGEETGGAAIFPSPESKRIRAHLLPTNAVTWTRVPGNDSFETTEYAYGSWTVADLGEHLRVVPQR